MESNFSLLSSTNFKFSAEEFCKDWDTKSLEMWDIENPSSINEIFTPKWYLISFFCEIITKTSFGVDLEGDLESQMKSEQMRIIDHSVMGIMSLIGFAGSIIMHLIGFVIMIEYLSKKKKNDGILIITACVGDFLV